MDVGVSDIIFVAGMFAAALVGGITDTYLVDWCVLHRSSRSLRLSQSQREKALRRIWDERSWFAMRRAWLPFASGYLMAAVSFATDYGPRWRVFSVALLFAGYAVSCVITVRQVTNILNAQGPKASRRDHQPPTPKDHDGSPRSRPWPFRRRRDRHGADDSA